LTQIIQKPDFWQDQSEAVRVTQELSDLQQELTDFEGLKNETDPSVLAQKIAEKEIQVFLSGKYDKGTALLSIMSGAGGQDAQDWVTMLLRMYQRYADRQGFKTKILDQSFGEGVAEGRAGIKSVALEITGKYAYGYLKKESGVHRLVRISPFSAQSLRHTSFALVEVLPEISSAEEQALEIKPEELSFEVCKASGPGGQNVNKRMTAVKITHLPTKVTVASQTERSLAQNKESALKMLYAKLYHLKEEAKATELAQIKGKQVAIEWGSQIRSYVLHPYQLVKDVRTNVETSDTAGVLDGKLDEFIEAEIKHHD